jgi:phage regulator Rha-like protein
MTKESDKDIVDTLYTSYELILKIKEQFIEFDEFRPQVPESTSMISQNARSTKAERDQAEEVDDQRHETYQEHLHHFQKKHSELSHQIDALGKKVEHLVLALTKHHTSAADLLQEMENIRTYKILSGEAFLLGAILPLKPKKK